MKKILIILFVAVFHLANAQDEPIYWIHGFQFQPIPTTDLAPGRWDLYSQKFAGERSAVSFIPNYARTNQEVEGGIVNSANVLSSQITDNPKTLLIAHSMGGLVARRMDQDELRDIGGIVTVATPHNGARIATNLQNGNVVKAAQDGFYELSRGPASTIIDIAFPFSSGGLNAEGLTNLLWDNTLENELLRALPPTNTSTLTDLMPNSVFLNMLNRNNPNIPIVNVITKENNHQMLRMGASAMANPEEQPLHSHDDGTLNSARTEAESWYKALKDYYLALRWVRLTSFRSLSRKANHYQAGEAYLDHGLESDYNYLNGGNSFESVVSYRDVWVCDGNSNPDGLSGRSLSMPIDPLPDPDECDPYAEVTEECRNCEWEEQSYTTYSYFNFDQDGLVTVEMQTLNITGVSEYFALSVNHMEVGNHPQMTHILNDIFNRPEPGFRRPLR